MARDLPWTEKKLRELPAFEFENWAVIALGGRKNKAQVGDKGFFVSFDFSSDAMREIQRFFVEEQRIIIPVTVQEILDEQIAHKLA